MSDFKYIALRKKLKENGINLRRIPMKEKKTESVFNFVDFFEFESILIWLAVKRGVAGENVKAKYYFKDILNFKHKVTTEEYIKNKSKDITDKPSRRNFEQQMNENRNHTLLMNEKGWREEVLEEIKRIAPEYVFYEEEKDLESSYLLLVIDKW